MRRDKKTSKDFYKHSESNEIFVIERRWDGTILGSCPAMEPLKDLDAYKCKTDNNLWLAEISDKLILI